MDLPRRRLAHRQADYAAVITALRAVRERLRGQRISARADDPEALARVAFMLIDITVAVMLRERQEAGRTEDEARADAIEWLEAQVAHTEIELLESGAVFNPATPVLGYGIPEEADRQLRPSRSERRHVGSAGSRAAGRRGRQLRGTPTRPAPTPGAAIGAGGTFTASVARS